MVTLAGSTRPAAVAERMRARPYWGIAPKTQSEQDPGAVVAIPCRAQSHPGSRPRPSEPWTTASCNLSIVASSPKEKVLLGEAGEHLVLSRLMRHGRVASQAPRAWRADDILIEGGARVQVKASIKGAKHGWVVKNVPDDRDLFFAFVDFSGGGDEAVIYVLPSAEVQRSCELDAQAYRRRNPTWQDNGMRKFQDPFPADGETYTHYPPGWLQQYREAWHLIPG
jgi:hypothetical protein